MSTPVVPIKDRPWLLSNVPLVTFVARTWMLIIATLVSNWAVLSKIEYFVKKQPDGTFQGVTLFEMLGAVLYVPALGCAVFLFYLLALHLFFRATLDKDAHDGVYVTDWRALTSSERMWQSTILRVGFFIGFCILCAGMAKG